MNTEATTPYPDQDRDLDHDQSRAPEEDSPESAEHAESACLLVQLLGEDLRPRAQVDYELTGPGIQLKGRTDEDGVLEVEGCVPGAYELSAEGRRRLVHTLCPEDLVDDASPYRVVLAAS